MGAGVLLAFWISAASKVSLDEVRQEAANVAFAEKAFAETQERFTDDLAELEYQPTSGVDVHIVTTPEEDKFCVDVVSSDYSARTWDSRFRDDGETVLLAGGTCQGPVRPGSSEEPASWFDSSSVDPATPTPSLSIRGWLFVPSPSAHRVAGQCSGANPNEGARSLASYDRLEFSTDRAGRDVIGATTTSAGTRLALVRLAGSGLTCGWRARFVGVVPAGTHSFFIRDTGPGYWGPYTPSETRGLVISY